ncbi:hypothetical protein CkaCkLH20_11103 [Colletotrichum karsti]|uniref:Uncharacterized protein n=1 Tax=Colletotrichum karsti TaxID=1095194 RepID=A0A9P6LFS2_9PEZI|nr:uncharacterized protein CkaCkLH20_11103 [Colletotrichum karsti]KAF9871456.1 hypothetical protein CkaCkLH20_11103 [Colletotrichum karsti]
MKLSTLLTSTTALLATNLVGTAHAGAACMSSNKAGTKFWEINIDDVDDVKAVCGLLWDNLARWPGCTVNRPNGCGSPFGGNNVYMYFSTSLVCNKGMVKSAFWHATHNRYGSISSC